MSFFRISLVWLPVHGFLPLGVNFFLVYSYLQISDCVTSTKISKLRVGINDRRYLIKDGTTP